METIAARFNLTTDKPPATPIGMHQLITNKDLANHIIMHLYQRKISSALYPVVITRPDIAFTAAKLSSFLSNPSPDHIVATNQYIQYLYGS